VYAEPTNLTSIQALFDYADNVGGGYFYLLIPVSLWFIAFLYLQGKGYRVGDSMMASSFGCLLVSGLLYALGGLSSTHMFYIVGVLIISMIYAYLKND